MRCLTVFGTRPEAIKLAPVVRAVQATDGVKHALCVTAQHREMLDQVLDVFNLRPDFDLNVMKPGQDLSYITSAVIDGVGRVIDEFLPDWVIVQGDTTTAFASALAAFYRKVKVAHVEAGLRTGNIFSPWPEEMNRKLVTQLSSMHFAPTQKAADNLYRENVSEALVEVTGNTVIDALLSVATRLTEDRALQTRYAARFSFLNSSRRLILVTGHRRENFDGGLARVCQALVEIARRGDVEMVYPVHLNPQVQATAKATLAGCANIHLIEPLDYLPFVYLMQRAYLIVTDSGGIQEEAPGLGKPVLVTRDTTERPEAIEAGTARLVGTSSEALIGEAGRLLDDPDAYRAMARARNPFGDGTAAQRIVCRLMREPST